METMGTLAGLLVIITGVVLIAGYFYLRCNNQTNNTSSPQVIGSLYQAHPEETTQGEKKGVPTSEKDVTELPAEIEGTVAHLEKQFLWVGRNPVTTFFVSVGNNSYPCGFYGHLSEEKPIPGFKENALIKVTFKNHPDVETVGSTRLNFARKVGNSFSLSTKNVEFILIDTLEVLPLKATDNTDEQQ